MQWIGERFFEVSGRWVDAASGLEVRMIFTRERLVDPVEWNERCARLSMTRHPLLNVLTDWGAAPGGHLFEAFETGSTVRAGGARGEEALEHLSRFLRASELSLDGARCARAIRPVVGGNDAPVLRVGITLQPRPELQVIEEALESAAGAGPAVIDVVAPDGSGARTFRTLAARAARLRGYVPLTLGAVQRCPDLLREVEQRHVCLFDRAESTRGEAAAVTQLLAMLSSASTRRHVVLRFRRDAAMAGRAVVLGPMGLRTLVGMVYVDPEHGPAEEALFHAARAADGQPGRFVDTLCGAGAGARGALLVHEARPEYTVAPPAPAAVPSPRPGRVLGAAERAPARAAYLARGGRHAAAVRALERAFRVFLARERPRDAARCALELGTLALDRGHVKAALDHFARGGELASGEATGMACAIARGVALTDAARVDEAEAVLRAVMAAEALDDDVRVSGAAALARTLYWQRRHEDAIATAAAVRELPASASSHARLLAVLARAEARAGRTAAALASARAAQQRAASVEDPRVKCSAELALAEALTAAGDPDGARASLTRCARMARAAHLPLFRLRAATAAAGAVSAGRLARRLVTRRLPPLLARRATMSPPHRPPTPVEPVADVETLLDVAQRCSDDRTALDAICRTTRERLRATHVVVVARDERTVALDGRAPGPPGACVREVLASGVRVPPDARREPLEAVEPIRYGGEVIAVLYCRWPAGLAVDFVGATALLRAAALSAAAPARGVLDQAVPQPPGTWGDLMGDSTSTGALRDAVARAARAPFPVLIEGESGSGKELVARAIHRLGPRRDRRLCALNCAALSDELVEAELFGHTRGAFTGAATERAGLFEEADGGTLFLDEVAELSARAQAKLLRVLQEGEVRRVGENHSRRVDVRIVAASNRSLEREVAAGRFRADLRFRMDVIRIVVPPLRERVADIPMLATHFWRDAAVRVGSQATLSGEALAALSRYDWPGNVRELQNAIAWMAVHSPRRGRVGPRGLPDHLAHAAATPANTLEAARDEFERRYIRAALATAQGQRTRAASALGISRQGLSKMMRRLQIE